MEARRRPAATACASAAGMQPPPARRRARPAVLLCSSWVVALERAVCAPDGERLMEARRRPAAMACARGWHATHRLSYSSLPHGLCRCRTPRALHAAACWGTCAPSREVRAGGVLEAHSVAVMLTKASGAWMLQGAAGRCWGAGSSGGRQHGHVRDARPTAGAASRLCGWCSCCAAAAGRHVSLPCLPALAHGGGGGAGQRQMGGGGAASRHGARWRAARGGAHTAQIFKRKPYLELREVGLPDCAKSQKLKG